MDFVEKLTKAFTERTWQSVLDIILMAVIIYAVIAFLRKNNLARLIKYFVLAAAVAIVLSSDTLGLPLTGRVVSYVGLIIIVLVLTLFPQELRRKMLKAGSPKEVAEVYTTQYDVPDETLAETIQEIVRAAQNMSKKDIGALIVVAPNALPSHILESGTRLDAEVSCQLLESIFNTKAPLHDGAVFIRGNRVLSAGCFLPLSQNSDIDKELGTRHRAALGVTENYNLIAIIVSEETGVISVAEGGELKRYFDTQMLTDTLEEVYGLKAASVKTKRQRKR